MVFSSHIERGTPSPLEKRHSPRVEAPTDENPAPKGEAFRSGDRFRDRYDLRQNNDQDHELQVRDHVKQRFFHHRLLVNDPGRPLPLEGDELPPGVTTQPSVLDDYADTRSASFEDADCGRAIDS